MIGVKWFQKWNTHYKQNIWKKFSNKHRDNLSKSHKWKSNWPRSVKVKLKISLAQKWKFVPEETRKKISESWKWRIPWNKWKWKKIEKTRPWRATGSRHWNWKGWINSGITDFRGSIEYKLWRKVILEKYNFTCQCCLKSWWKLEAHHINNFSDFYDLRLDINNWLLLCEDCHKKFHKEYWRKNNTKEQIDNFIEEVWTKMKLEKK